MEPIEEAIYATVAYADIFQYPLTEAEIHRYLIGLRAARSEVRTAIGSSRVLRQRLSRTGEFFTLAGREHTLDERARRREQSAVLWPRAARYGAWMGALPFVRMVAVTGSLAVDNAGSGADLDYLVVTRPGRVWFTRSLVILFVRCVSRMGDVVCPNYFLSEESLELSDRSLFAAHEMVQMVPLTGLPVYRRMHAQNGWVREYLPNAEAQYVQLHGQDASSRNVRPLIEQVLRLPPVDWFEKWEMERKVRKYGSLLGNHPEACFSPDRCKGHFDDHGRRIQKAFAERMTALQEVCV